MTYSQFFNQDKLQSCYVLYGDAFLAKKCQEYVKEKLGIDSEYDISVFDSENFSVDALIASCEQISFFAKNRLAIVKNLTNISEKDKTNFLNYIQNINPMCTILLVDTSKSGIFDFLKTEKVVLELNDYEIKNIINETAQEYNKKIEDEASNSLILFCQKDLCRINLEIQKLAMYVGDRDVITFQDVKVLVAPTEEFVVFELTTAMAQKNAQKSMILLSKLLGNADQNARLFSLLSTTIRRMFFVAISKDKSESELATIFGVKEYAIKKLREQSKNFSAKTLKNLVYELCDLEYMTKNGQMTQENAMYYIIQYSLV